MPGQSGPQLSHLEPATNRSHEPFCLSPVNWHRTTCKKDTQVIYRRSKIKLAMVQFVNLLNPVQTQTRPEVQASGLGWCWTWTSNRGSGLACAQFLTFTEPLGSGPDNIYIIYKCNYELSCKQLKKFMWQLTSHSSLLIDQKKKFFHCPITTSDHHQPSTFNTQLDCWQHKCST